MKLSAEDGIQLIADLWMDSYPLTRKYFGSCLGQLLNALQADPFEEHFTTYAFHPQRLEKRLESLEPLKLTQAVVSEIGNIQDPVELDRRLVDAWAELRFASQLCLEGFTDICKVLEIGDYTAKKGDRSFTFQVTRINTALKGKVGTPHSGESVSGIYERFGDRVSWLFWDTLQRKSSRFKDWEGQETRCIVIVSDDEDLQDPLVRHIACQQIRDGIHALVSRHFEELVWLPDLGNGAWFEVGAQPEDTRCLADWKDGLEDHDRITVERREVDLNSVIPRWKEQ